MHIIMLVVWDGVGTCCELMGMVVVEITTLSARLDFLGIEMG